jgi:hypothetical protein
MSLLTFCVGGTLRNSTFRRKAHMMILTGSIARSSQMVVIQPVDVLPNEEGRRHVCR